MNKVTMKEFYEKQAEFLAKHECRMEQIGTPAEYHKTWLSDDGANMVETNRIITERVFVEVKGVSCVVDIQLWETECYSTEFGSMYMYQRA